MSRSSKAAQMTQYEKMTQTPVSKLVIMLGIPTTISMLVTNIYNMADTYFVSALGNSASGAVGIVFGLMAIIQAFGFMLGQGAGSIISRRLGNQDVESAKVTASLSFFTALFLGVVIGVLGLIFIDPLMLLLGSTDTILPYARDYGRYILMAAPVMMASFVLNNILRYEGKANLAMIGLVTGGLLNMIGDPILISGFDMGIAGAGLSTALSQCVSFCILLSMFLRGKTQSKIAITAITKNPRGITDVVKTGFPSLLRQGLNSISTMVLNGLAGGYGDAAVAAMSIVNRLCFFIFAVGLGIGQGFQPVAGFNYGAKKYSRVKKAFFFTWGAGEVLLGTLAVIAFFISGSLVGIFRDDVQVIEIGTQALRFQLVALFFQPVTICASMLFQSVGENKLASFFSLLRSGLFFIPTLIILEGVIGLTGIQVSQTVADVLAFIVAVPLVLRYIRRLPADE
ncbi:MAG: MATE family efflux transporter [Lachnospiraceae bacterium]|nr:MATE family efflux transporter [Lachnospiraceae bacterium]